jgi:hypothetical protein
MGYFSGGYNRNRTGYTPPPIPTAQTKAPEPENIRVNLDPTNPVETVAAGIGGLFTGAVGAAKGVADFAGGIPVIGDIGKAIGKGLGAFGEVGIEGIAQVKDVAKGALDVAMLPSKVVQTGAAAVRASGVFGEKPEDVKRMMAGGSDFGEVVNHLVENNRAFSDNAAANLGFSLITDPLNYLPITKPFTLARNASKLAGVERAAISEAADVITASRAGRSVMDFEKATSLTVSGQTKGTLSRALIGSRMTPEDLAFLDKWRVPAALYEATIGKMGKGFNALVSAVSAPVFIGAAKALGEAPRTVLEGMSAAGKGEWATSLAKSFGKGLSNTMVFSISRLFAKSTSGVMAAKADFAIKLVGQAKKLVANGKIANGEEWVAGRLVEEGLFDAASAAENVKRIYSVSDASRRSVRRQWIDELSEAETRRVSANAAGDYKAVQDAGGIRVSDTALEAQAHITEGAYQLERMSAARRRQLFVDKGVAAIGGGSKERVARALSGEVAVTNPEQAAFLAKIWDDTVSGLDAAGQARYVQMMEIAAYGAQGTNTAIIRSAITAIKNGDSAKLEEIIGRRLEPSKFEEVKKFLDSPENAKYNRINLVKADTITKERLEAIQAAGVKLESGNPLSAADLASLPEDLVSQIMAGAKFIDGTATADDLASAVTSYFPDFHLIVGKDTASIWAELGGTIDQMIKGGHYVTLASADELARFSSLLDNLGSGAGKATDALLSSGRYSLGFAPETNVIKRSGTRVTDDSIEYVSESLAPFLDSTAGLIDESLDLTAASFSRSPLRQIADKWLTPVSSKAVQQQQLETAIRIAEDAGGTTADGRRLIAKVNELSLNSGITPRGLIMNDGLLRKTMQDALGPKLFDDMVAKNGGDARRILMRMYAGSTDVVGRTQSFTGTMKVKFPQLAIMTDYIYPTLKFKLNPNFYIQEAIESPFFNYLRAIDRVLTSKRYESKYGWARRIPGVETVVGRKLGLARVSDGPSIEVGFAELVFGQPGSALRAELDIGNTIIILGGKMANETMSTPAGIEVVTGFRQSFTNGIKEMVETVKNPYPMKQNRRNAMAFNLALDKVADEIRFKFPQQWTAASKSYGTNDVRTVMINIIRDQRNGYLHPGRVVGASRPRNFGFSGPGSVEAARQFRVSVEKLAQDIKKAPDTHSQIAIAQSGAILLKDAAEKSAATGNDIGKIMKLLNEASSPSTSNHVGKIDDLLSEAKFYEEFASQTVKDFGLVDDAVRQYLDPAIYGGFSRESVSASLAQFRSYGTDFPGMEAVVSKLRAGEKLAEADIRALRFASNNLMDIHGPEEILLGAFRETLKDTAETANRIHFYNPNRSALERTLNHPYLAFYPLSYTIGKIVPEFARAAFVKMPFTKSTRPFAGYAKVQMVQDHIATLAEADPEFGEFLTKSDFVFMIKQLFPGIPGDVSIGGPRWLNRSKAQFERSQRPGVGGREPAQFDPGYVARSVFDQAKSQSVWGVGERYAGAFSEVWDYFDGPIDFNPGP